MQFNSTMCHCNGYIFKLVERLEIKSLKYSWCPSRVFVWNDGQCDLKRSGSTIREKEKVSGWFVKEIKLTFFNLWIFAAPSDRKFLTSPLSISKSRYLSQCHSEWCFISEFLAWPVKWLVYNWHWRHWRLLSSQLSRCRWKSVQEVYFGEDVYCLPFITALDQKWSAFLIS